MQIDMFYPHLYVSCLFATHKCTDACLIMSGWNRQEYDRIYNFTLIRSRCIHVYDIKLPMCVKLKAVNLV